MNVHKGFLILVIAVLCSTVFASNLVGKDAPEITIREWITPNPPDVKNLSNRVCVIEFWATWCSPCVAGVPHLIELNKKYQDLGLTFISLSADNSAEKVRKFVESKKINYHVAIDHVSADSYGITGYPTAVVINHLGKVTWFGHPSNNGFEKAIIGALAKGPPPLLTGIDLGPFKNMRIALWGGKDFANAYRQIQSCVNKGSDGGKSALARLIIDTIDTRIAERIKYADSLRKSKPLEAFNIYADILFWYDGIEAVKPAQKSFAVLNQAGRSSKAVLASRASVIPVE